jgi:hypothetical protein
MSSLYGRLALASLAALALTAAAPLADAADAPATPQLAGNWKLNEKKSEDFREKMEAMRGGGGGFHGGYGGGAGMGGGGWGGHGGGGGYGGGHRGGGPGGGPPGGGPEAEGRGGPPDSTRQAEMRWLMEPPAMLQIVQTDTAVVLTDHGAPIQTLALTAAPTAGGLRFDAQWKSSKLEATRTNARGRKTSETFELKDGGKTLAIVTTIEGGPDRPPVEFKRVFDRYEGNP